MKKAARKPNPFFAYLNLRMMLCLRALKTTPCEYNLNFSSWTALAVQEFFKQCCQITVKLNYIYHFLNAHKIVSKSASRKNYKANADEIRQFKAELFHKFLQAIRHYEVIVFLDETHMHQGNRQYGYAGSAKEAF